MSDQVLSRRDFLKTTVKSTLGTLGLGLLIWGYGHEIEPRLVVTEHVELNLPRLTPAFDGYRIVHISDIHIDHWMPRDHLADILARVNAQDADLVVITGDFISSEDRLNETVIEHLVTALKTIQARDGVLAVLGNHDYWAGPERVRDALRRSNVRLLENDVFTLRRDNEVLHIAGMGDLWGGHDRLDLVLAQLPATGPAIMLMHQPHAFEDVAATGRIDVQLSGHTHGGQISIPGIGRPWKKYSAGLYRSGDAVMYINRGLGYMFPSMRVGSRPEITVLTLRAP